MFLQIKAGGLSRSRREYREKRTAILEIACGAAKLRQPDLQRVVGIAIDAPKYAGKYNSEDMLLMEFSNWTPELDAHYEEANKVWRFFSTLQMKTVKYTVSEFPSSPKTKASSLKRTRVGRNDLGV